ncbi:MAG TPA: response regulator [Bryobacteraceae bacterium]|nr:response regulator [Bryobacteraceae bacterium]
MSNVLRVLQVEDSENDAAMVVRLLENAGYEVQGERVETAARMRAALRKQDWDAIIADYHLPQFDAPGALKVLRESGLDLPFLVVSGAVGEDLAVAMMKAGAHDYVMKSSMARLVPAVEREIHEAAVRRERRRAAEGLRLAHEEAERSRRLLDAVFTAQTDAVAVYDTAGVVIRTNPAAAGIYGFDPTGMRIADVLEKLQIPGGPGLSATERALAGAVVVNLELAAAERTFETSSLPMRDAAGGIIGAVTLIRDISRRKHDEQRLLQAQKLESIALLAGGIAHDFNNILTVVSGNISLALEDACTDCPAAFVLPGALESLQRAASLTRQLLAYAGKGAFVREPVPVSSAARRTIDRLLPSLPERIRLVADLASGIPPLLMDPGQLELVFSNLILNAVESIPGGQTGTVRVRTAADGDAVKIEVSDDGCGMDAETQKRIFDPFFTTKFTGRGLGLAAVEGIVRTSGGRIAVESAAGHGCRISVILPVPKTAFPAPPAAAPRAVSSNAYGAVLIVDDEPMVRQMAGAFLKKRGIPVLEAANGKEAIERLNQDGGAVRAVLLDLAMPEMSGDAALPIIRRLRPEVRVIVSSGFQEGDVQQHFRQIEACSFLPKPYTPQQLYAEILPVVSRWEKTA